MVELFKHKIDGINIYIDEYQEDNKILKGRKDGVSEHTFMIMNKKTAELLYSIFIIKERKEKIMNIRNKIYKRN